jgi:hypothetical protein
MARPTLQRPWGCVNVATCCIDRRGTMQSMKHSSHGKPWAPPANRLKRSMQWVRWSGHSVTHVVAVKLQQSLQAAQRLYSSDNRSMYNTPCRCYMSCCCCCCCWYMHHHLQRAPFCAPLLSRQCNTPLATDEACCCCCHCCHNAPLAAHSAAAANHW